MHFAPSWTWPKLDFKISSNSKDTSGEAEGELNEAIARRTSAIEEDLGLVGGLEHGRGERRTFLSGRRSYDIGMFVLAVYETRINELLRR